MGKLLFFIFVLVLVSISAQPDYFLKISDGNKTLGFNVENPSNILLGYWANDVNTEVTLEFEGRLGTEYSRLRPLKAICHPVGSNIWNFFVIKRNDQVVTVDPYNRRYAVSSHWNFRVSIKSTIRTYWKFCASLYQCDLRTPHDIATEVTGESTSQSTNDVSRAPLDSALGFTTIGFLLVCCLVVVTVIGMAVYIMRGENSSLDEPGSNKRTEAIYEEVQLPGKPANVFREKENYETIDMCGELIQKQV